MTMASLLSRRGTLYGLDDKIVLDIGSLYIKCGFSGESRPRSIVPTCIHPYANVLDGSRTVGELITLWNLEIQNDEIEHLEDRIADLLYRIYQRELLVDPRQRKVILCESALLPMPAKRAITRALFNVLQVPAVTFLSSSWSALISCGKQTGLVVDVGYHEATVQAVYDGRPILHSIKSIPHGGHALTARLADLIFSNTSDLIINNQPVELNPDSSYTICPLQMWEDLKARYLHVRPIGVSTTSIQDDWEQQKPVVYGYENIRVTFPSWVCESACEVLFEKDDDGMCVAGIMLDALMNCPSDTRTELLQNIVITGGTSCIHGFSYRLYHDLIRKMKESKRWKELEFESKVKFLKPVFPASVLPWVGASLVGSLKLPFVEVNRTEYVKDPVAMIPDWSLITQAA
ncbi:hypothetical protein SmJEL517_g06093 [Synchytrium microbalum]|uniref:Actin n=1 Tax=Synchytrium microbalum TaxID=1806994 RepID=A0A507BWZ0_9FUNG|nr:uncharacterized protein SmJEL517_g06093 [Synchytrium microbalum]TPX30324.1 hypothetical protein SmJEL517_g06093 [Synchytrium microbalum]